MTSDFDQKVAMLKAVQYTLLTNNDIISSDSILIETSNLLSEYTRMLNYSIKHNYGENQNGYNDHYTPEEKVRKDLLKIVLALNSFAAMGEDINLMTETSKFKYEMDQLDKTEVERQASGFLDIAISNITSLEHFGISDKFLTEFSGRLKKLQENIAVDNYNKDYPSDHENEEIKLEEVLNFLENTVDNQINNLRSIYPRFYNEYRTARMLKEPSDLTRRDQTSQVNYYF